MIEFEFSKKIKNLNDEKAFVQNNLSTQILIKKLKTTKIIEFSLHGYSGSWKHPFS